MPTPLATARDLIRSAKRIMVLTGAGVSAESGVPTFRGAGGLWRERRPEELATPGAFARDPRLVWEWYGWRREIIAGCRPNAAHRALARLALARPGVRIITQNVDGLHAAAAHEEAGGGDARAALPLELHGSIFHAQCTACGDRTPHREAIDATTLESLPHCGRCDGLLRPNVVWFGESLDAAVLQDAYAAAAAADVCLVVGTSGVVQPAASLASVTREAKGAVIEINPVATPLSAIAAATVRGAAGEVLPAMLSDGSLTRPS